tara:strand:+ start:42484 stop:44850 length:2367 start_codon:yes stop_codon:yes gene_type:complete
MLKFSAVIFCSCRNFIDSVHIKSPSGIIDIKVKKSMESIVYEVYLNGEKIIIPSRLGLIFKNKNGLFKQSRIKHIEENYHDQFWELPWGEVKNIRNNYTETKIYFENQKNIEIGSVIFRAYDDGIAFRYHVKNIIGNKDSITIVNELTQFNLNENADVWWIPAYQNNRYEELYNNTKISEMDTSHTPLTIRYNNGTHLSIHEASLVNYSSMQIYPSNNTDLNCDLAPWSNGDKVRTSLPFFSPWRTIKISSSATGLLNSYLTLNCNEPSKIEDTSWIKPSKYIGIWWGMIIGKWTWSEGFRHGATNERSKKYIDFASKHGFDEVLIEGWAADWKGLFPEDSNTVSFTNSTSDFDLRMIQNYAKSKGVSIQVYHETSSNTKNYLAQIDSAFSLLNELEIKNVKVGQVGKNLDKKEFHYSQYGINYYRTVLKKALEYKIGVNFHEPIKDTGERRTYPNMLTREGARGMEYNAWYGGNPPNHTTILPFTRLLNSPMDFTPGIFDLLIENTNFDVSTEHPGVFTVIDSGNGYHNLTYKCGESLWKEIPMDVDTIFSFDRPVYIWKTKQNLQVGDWEWGVSADHRGINEYDLWLPQVLNDKKNRKISVTQDGLVSGETKIVIPWQSLEIIKENSHNREREKKSPPRVSTTIAKQLALYIIIHSPLQMASDFIENYNNHPAFQFIKDVPVDWDTTVYINGEIGNYVTIARKEKNTKDWYIGGITNENERIMNLNLSFLDDGVYRATIYADTENSDWKSNPGDYNISLTRLTKNDSHKMKLAKGGGQAIKLKYLY